jgi:hypothetical protein
MYEFDNVVDNTRVCVMHEEARMSTTKSAAMHATLVAIRGKGRYSCPQVHHDLDNDAFPPVPTLPFVALDSSAYDVARLRHTCHESSLR